MKTKLLACILLLISCAAVQAQVVFTVTATSYYTEFGYTAGQSYTFIFTTGANFANTSSSIFTGAENKWSEETTADDQLFTSITGTGLSGGFSRPGANYYDPYSFINVDVMQNLRLFAGADTSPVIGLTTLDNTQLINRIDVDLTTTASFLMLSSYVAPNSHFSSYLGAVPGAAGAVKINLLTSPSAPVFTVTGVTITPVPEPSTYAMLAGIGAIGLAALRGRFGVRT